MKLMVVPQGHVLRPRVEFFIADTYAKTYAAKVGSFAPMLVALMQNERIACAAGLRFAADGFFSECYVDEPIEVLLSRAEKRPISRGAVFEVVSLCSCSPVDAPRFVHEIVSFGERARFDWSIFTATDRLRRLLHRIGLPLIDIAEAHADCVADPASWGTYYDARPCVLAVPRSALASTHARMAKESRRVAHS